MVALTKAKNEITSWEIEDYLRREKLKKLDNESR